MALVTNADCIVLQVLDDRENAKRSRASAVQLPAAEESVPREERPVRGSRLSGRPQIPLQAQEASPTAHDVATTSRNAH